MALFWRWSCVVVDGAGSHHGLGSGRDDVELRAGQRIHGRRLHGGAHRGHECAGVEPGDDQWPAEFGTQCRPRDCSCRTRCSNRRFPAGVPAPRAPNRARLPSPTSPGSTSSMTYTTFGLGACLWPGSRPTTRPIPRTRCWLRFPTRRVCPGGLGSLYCEGAVHGDRARSCPSP